MSQKSRNVLFDGKKKPAGGKKLAKKFNLKNGCAFKRLIYDGKKRGPSQFFDESMKCSHGPYGHFAHDGSGR